VFSDPLTQRLADFVVGVGIAVRPGEAPDDALLPGLDVQSGVLVIDERRLAHPGDILHEAGHIAVCDPETRSAQPISSDPGEEMAAIAWSWAALTHLGLEPEVVFHADGYRDWSKTLIDSFRTSPAVGVPMLQYYGLSFEPRLAAERGVAPFPHMLRWLR
jgi:hypothetical protein